jgi:hypothetical protein
LNFNEIKSKLSLFIAVSSVVLGIVIGPFIEKWFDPFLSDDTKVILFFNTIIGILIVSFLVVLSMYLRWGNKQQEDIIEVFKNIDKKIELSATFVSDEPTQEATGAIYRSVISVLEQAESEILILWRPSKYRSPEESIRSEPWKEQRERYYRLLIEKCKQRRNSNFIYRRILQIPDAHKIIDGAVDSSIINDEATTNHCRELLDFAKVNPSVASLKYAPQFSEQTIIIVDRKYVLIAVDVLDPDNQSSAIDSMISFKNTNGDFVNYLHRFFKKVDAHSSMVKQIVEYQDDNQ